MGHKENAETLRARLHEEIDSIVEIYADAEDPNEIVGELMGDWDRHDWKPQDAEKTLMKMGEVLGGRYYAELFILYLFAALLQMGRIQAIYTPSPSSEEEAEEWANNEDDHSVDMRVTDGGLFEGNEIITDELTLVLKDEK